MSLVRPWQRDIRQANKSSRPTFAKDKARVDLTALHCVIPIAQQQMVYISNTRQLLVNLVTVAIGCGVRVVAFAVSVMPGKSVCAARTSGVFPLRCDVCSDRNVNTTTYEQIVSQKRAQV